MFRAGGSVGCLQHDECGMSLVCNVAACGNLHFATRDVLRLWIKFGRDSSSYAARARRGRCCADLRREHLYRRSYAPIKPAININDLSASHPGIGSQSPRQGSSRATTLCAISNLRLTDDPGPIFRCIGHRATDAQLTAPYTDQTWGRSRREISDSFHCDKICCNLRLGAFGQSAIRRSPAPVTCPRDGVLELVERRLVLVRIR